MMAKREAVNVEARNASTVCMARAKSKHYQDTLTTSHCSGLSGLWELNRSPFYKQIAPLKMVAAILHNTSMGRYQ